MAAPSLRSMCRVRRLLVLLLVAFSSACAAEPRREELEWIRANAIPLETCEAGHGFEDLQPLAALIGDARIVSLGECTHGTREVFQMKHRLVEYLASRGGITIFSIEANMPEAYRLNEYVLEGKGDPKKLIAGMYFWTWDTEEVLAMVEWMREFNESGKGRVEFTGFDMQTPDVAMDVVLAFLRKTDPGRVQTVENTYRELRNGRFEKSAGGEPGGPDPAVSSKNTGTILAQMGVNRDDYVKATSQKEADWAIQNARVVHQCLQLAANQTERDESMAANARWIIDNAPKDATIVLWAHNAHVNRRGRAMGVLLDRWYGKDQVVIGFAAGDGQYTARAREKALRNDNRLESPTQNSYEAYFHASGLPSFILELGRSSSDDPASSWLTRPRPFRSIGALAMEKQFFPVDIRSEYDAIVYFDTTTASRLLPGAGTRLRQQ